MPEWFYLVPGDGEWSFIWWCFLIWLFGAVIRLIASIFNSTQDKGE